MKRRTALDKAKDRFQELQMTKVAQHKKMANFEKSEARRVLIGELERKKAEKKAERRRRIEAFMKQISLQQHENLREKIKADLLYANRESMHITIALTLAIAFLIFVLLV